jgi:hypothetical protein
MQRCVQPSSITYLITKLSPLGWRRTGFTNRPSRTAWQTNHKEPTGVVLRTIAGGIDILAFRHPLAACQLVNRTSEKPDRQPTIVPAQRRSLNWQENGEQYCPNAHGAARSPARPSFGRLVFRAD